eukprot:1274246-Amphidinium_carterae.1
MLIPTEDAVLRCLDTHLIHNTVVRLDPEGNTNVNGTPVTLPSNVTCDCSHDLLWCFCTSALLVHRFKQQRNIVVDQTSLGDGVLPVQIQDARYETHGARVQLGHPQSAIP